jgi:hypothetical protein
MEPPPPPQKITAAATAPEFPVAVVCGPSLADRGVGTVGFLGGLLLYFGFCCCACGLDDRPIIRDTYNDHTVCGIVCPIPAVSSSGR